MSINMSSNPRGAGYTGPALAAPRLATDDHRAIGATRPLQRLARASTICMLLAATYAVAAKVGLSLAFVNASATAVWPPTGIALAAVLIIGPWVAPGIFVGALLANEMTAGTHATSLLIATGNTLEALVGGYLVNRFAGGCTPFNRGRDIFLFVLLAGLLSTTVSATVGVTTLSYYGFADWSTYRSTWLTWWLGDAAGAVVLAPALLLWNVNPQVDWSRAERLERLLWVVLLVAAGWIVFVVVSYPIEFVCLPLCVWAAFRFGQREAVTGTCLLAVIAIWGSLRGSGPFGRLPPNDALLLLQTFMTVTTIIGLAVGAAVSGRRAAEHHLCRLNDELEQRIHARTVALQSSEARLADAQEVAHIGSWEFNVPENLVWWSEELYRMYGVDRPTFHPSYDAFLDLVDPEDREKVRRSIQQSLEDAQPFEFEHRMMRPDGGVRVVHSKGRIVQNDRGQVIRLLGTGQDITDRKRLEEQLQQAQKMEAIGRLAGGVAHDFNNMLTSILGYAELLIQQIGPDKPMGRDLSQIQAAAQRAAALTKQLLAFSRKQALAMAPVDLNEVVRTLEPMLGRLLGARVMIATTLADDLHRVLADAPQLEHLMINLSLNARDAMPQGGTLTIATRNVELGAADMAAHPGAQAGSYAIMRVTDTGVGMSPEVQARIFEPFFTTKERGRGTGLGLAAIYGTVKQLGGFIDVDSRLGTGTTFTIYLPKTEQVAQTSRVSTQTISPPGTETILLVEDEDSVRAFTKTALQRFGYRVLEAASAEAALIVLEHAEAPPIHLLLTDIVLPGMDGWELAVRLTQDRPDIQVLFMSGYADNWTDHPLLKQKAHLLEKPFSTSALFTKIRQLFGDGPSDQNATRTSQQPLT
jgi:two-component system cell cycle sensor histidine kinase/response regulator CckA